MTISDKIATSELDQAIEGYARALSAIEKAATNPSKQEVLKVLLARDAVEEALPEKTKASTESIATLIELDKRLKNLAGAIASDDKLADCRQSLNPPSSAWWWFLEPPPKEEKRDPDRFDWLWNGLTVACLVLAGTFATHTAKAFSASNGMDLLQTFGTISQGAGLVLVTGGALTDKGQTMVKTVLSSLKIPPRFHAEATFGLSAGLLLVTYGINKSLPNLGEFYYQQGKQHYDLGELSMALNDYEEANNLVPDRPEFMVAVGKIYESLGQFDKAQSYYQKGLLQGDPDSFNSVGRVIVQTAKKPEDAFVAEAYFELALKQPNIDEKLKAELYTNLGYAQMKRTSAQNLPKKQVEDLLEEAKQNLEKAIALEQNIPNKTPGWGMAHCYLATLLQQKGDRKRGEQEWQSCELAEPENIAQYELILGMAGEKIASRVQTKEIVDEDPRLAADAPKEVSSEAKGSPVAADEELKQKLYDQIRQNWQTPPTFKQNLVYKVTVSQDGAIAAIEPTDRVASDFVQQTPLSKLPKSDATQKPLSQFKVVFATSGQVEISPWLE